MTGNQQQRKAALAGLIAFPLSLTFSLSLILGYLAIRRWGTTFDLFGLQRGDYSLLCPVSLISAAVGAVMWERKIIRWANLGMILVNLWVSLYFGPIFTFAGAFLFAGTLLAGSHWFQKNRWPIFIATNIMCFIILVYTISCSLSWEGPMPPSYRAKNDLRNLATALAAYYVDNNAYPPSTVEHRDQARWNTEIIRQIMPTFQRATPGGSGTLTTPVGYLTELPPDFCRYLSEDRTYVYYTPNGRTWILVSPGPDLKFELDWPTLKNLFHDDQPSTEVLTRLTYDPSNGTGGTGDIWRVKQ